MTDDDPGLDEDKAKLRDLYRLRELYQRYLPPSYPGSIRDPVPFMTPEDRAETLGILERVVIYDEPRWKTQMRQEMLLGLAEIEAHSLEFLEHGHPVITDDGRDRHRSRNRGVGS